MMTIDTIESEETRSTVDLRATAMRRRVVWEGDYDIRSAFFDMPAGMRIEAHHHSKSVPVTVLDGRIRVEREGQPVRRVAAGKVHFIRAGETHTETAEIDTRRLVTHGAARPPRLVRKVA